MYLHLQLVVLKQLIMFMAVHTFTSSGTFTTTKVQEAEVLIVAGGGGGSRRWCSNGGGVGGGGAGGILYVTGVTLDIFNNILL